MFSSFKYRRPAPGGPSESWMLLTCPERWRPWMSRACAASALAQSCCNKRGDHRPLVSDGTVFGPMPGQKMRKKSSGQQLSSLLPQSKLPSDHTPLSDAVLSISPRMSLRVFNRRARHINARQSTALGARSCYAFACATSIFATDELECGTRRAVGWLDVNLPRHLGRLQPSRRRSFEQSQEFVARYR